MPNLSDSRYSLRSLEVNAPWIRNIYIVTNGQVPSWLDTTNPRVHIITHAMIFPNASFLPTFSSPAIEMNLHRIPGLSDYFIYFNDDVFLGRPVFPYDFMSLPNTQYLFASWDAPKCAPNCRATSLGNGFCDFACNTEACGFDLGDCVSTPPPRGPPSNTTSVPKPFSRLPRGEASEKVSVCGQSCGLHWLGDGVMIGAHHHM